MRTGPTAYDGVPGGRQGQIHRDSWLLRHPFWDEMLELDPELFPAYTEFSSVPWRSGTLPPKLKEFVYIAFDTAATHLYVKGLKLHIENALGYGATPQEILEVMEESRVCSASTHAPRRTRPSQKKPPRSPTLRLAIEARARKLVIRGREPDWRSAGSL